MALVINFAVMIYFKKIVTHPLLIIFLFCVILISGEEIGGFYLFYILLGLLHLALHAVLGFLGIACLLFAYRNKTLIGSSLRVLGAILMISSLTYFFLQPNGNYNYDTFHLALPLSTLIVFSIMTIVFTLINISELIHSIHKKAHPLT